VDATDLDYLLRLFRVRLLTLPAPAEEEGQYIEDVI